MAIYMMREYVPSTYTWDYINDTRGSTKDSTDSNYSGVLITAKVNCQITKIKFGKGTPVSGTLKIAQGTTISASGTLYTITTSTSPNGIYELNTPFDLSENTDYVVCLTGTYRYWGSHPVTYPVSKTNIIYKKGVNLNGQWNDIIYNIRGIETLA